MKLKFLLPVVVFTSSLTTLKAQNERYMYDLNSEFHVGAGLKWGGMMVNVDGFNDLFTANDMPTFDNFNFGGGFEIYLGNRTNFTFYTLGASMYTQGAQNDSISSRLQTTYIEFYSDFNLLSSDKFMLHPSIGMNVAMAKININRREQSPDNIQGVIDDFSYTQRIKSDNIGIGLDLGIGSEVFFGSKLKQSIGVKLGYRFSITKNRFESAGIRVSDAPSMQLGGFYFSNFFTLW